MLSSSPLRLGALVMLVGGFLLGSGERLAAQGRLLQTLEAFYTPAAAAFTPDGRTLYVTNAARTDYGMLAGRGAVSRVEVGADGQLTVARAKWSEGLNSPLGVVVLPGAVGEFPAGTLAVAVGGRWTVVDRTTPVTDARERGTGLVFLDGSTGARLGTVFLGEGSKIVEALGHPITDPGPITADAAGNIYVADIAGLGLSTATGDRDRTGVVRLSSAAIRALLRDEAPPVDSVAFIHVPEVAAGLAWYERDQMLYWVTGPGYGDLAGAVLRLTGGNFGPGGEIETVSKENQPMVGACISPAGSLIVGHSHGAIGVIKRGRGKLKPVKFPDKTVFISPGQCAATTLADGRVLVVVPEMAAGGRPAWRHRLQVFTLPKDY